jgi:hypothetical protein
MSGNATSPKNAGEGMTREQLVRAHFDAYSDFAWKRHLEPDLVRYDLGADAMGRIRQLWNLYTERRDWAWWVDNVSDLSDDKLKAGAAKCRATIEAIEKPRSPRESIQSAFQAILNGDDLDKRRSPGLPPARTKTQEM